jgi:putative glutamine amidotransferase
VSAVVGVTAYTPAGGDGKSYALPCEYVESLLAAGVQPVLLAAGDAGAELGALDGLVLSGGGDVDPEVYGSKGHTAIYMVDRRRDEFELELVRVSLARGMPLLAICRGMQILNVALGGTLVAHLPERYGDSVAHRLPPRKPVAHQVEVAAGSELAGIVGAGTIGVMSWHHQAIDRMGRGLRAVAHAPDGVVEAVALEVGHWVVAVQWHPELSAASDARQAALFLAFAAAARVYRNQRRHLPCG